MPFYYNTCKNNNKRSCYVYPDVTVITGNHRVDILDKYMIDVTDKEKELKMIKTFILREIIGLEQEQLFLKV